LSCLHNIIYETYARRMHLFCQYPQLSELLGKQVFASRVRILAIGKAAWKMASLAALQMQKRDIRYDGYVLTRYGLSLGAIQNLEILEAGHPLPDESSIAHSGRIAAWLRGIPATDDLVVLLSGGGSALFELLPPDMTLPQLIDAHKQLISSGSAIDEVNRKRTEMSAVKGGKALKLLACSKVHVFAVSDVPGNDPHVLASGPFTPPQKGRKHGDAWVFESGSQKVFYHIVGDNASFTSALASDLKRQGFRVHLEAGFQDRSAAGFTTKLKDIIARAHSPRYKLKRPFLQVLGGETPVKVKGPGSGGRCSHLALSMAGTLARYKDCALFCFATDGSDNLPGSGGAMIDSKSLKQLPQQGFGMTRVLRDNDSFTALKRIHHILPSPVLVTNVNDVFVLSVGYDFDNPLSGCDDSELDIFGGTG